MLIAVAGTPGVGKTCLCRELAVRGLVVRDLKQIIIEGSLREEARGGQKEMLVDTGKLRQALEEMEPERSVDTVMDGHLSYLAPADICFILRLNPVELEGRLEARGYSPEKVNENVEAEAVSVVLVEALEVEKERLEGRPWTDLPSRCGIVLEIDATGRSSPDLGDVTMQLCDAFRGKRLNELAGYRPGRVDWLEVLSEWF